MFNNKFIKPDHVTVRISQNNGTERYKFINFLVRTLSDLGTDRS